MIYNVTSSEGIFKKFVSISNFGMCNFYSSITLFIFANQTHLVNNVRYYVRTGAGLLWVDGLIP